MMLVGLIFEFVDSLMNFLKLVCHRWVTKKEISLFAESFVNL